jgi:hypothetical protein
MQSLRGCNESKLVLEESQDLTGGQMTSRAVIDVPLKQQAVVSSSKRQRATNEEIALRAYDLFVLRGGVHGWDVQDWLQAEKECEGN